MLFTFPSWYLFTIDHKKYLVLGHSRPGFKRNFTSSALLKNTNHGESNLFAYGAITVFGRAFQLVQLRNEFFDSALFFWKQALGLATPKKHVAPEPSGINPPEGGLIPQLFRFRLLPFRSPLLRE